jgi:hypothetical protein
MKESKLGLIQRSIETHIDDQIRNLRDLKEMLCLPTTNYRVAETDAIHIAEQVHAIARSIAVYSAISSCTVK